MRGIALSKRRLESALDVSERAQLNRWLLERTLTTLRAWLSDMRQCVMVSVCSEALALARAAGARTVEEPGGALGHNHAAAAGLAHARASGARKAMMLPCDLPLLSACALDDFARRAERADIVLAPDRHGSGTNAVIVDAGSDIEFKFGDDSLARYTAWAHECGRSISICTRIELGFDLDTPQDLAAWHERYDRSASHHAELEAHPRGG
jgi:2-phospho-L-lactate guanylyltransferase